MSATNELKYIPLNKIRQNKEALREVDKKSEEYLGLVDSIRENGVYNAINVRPFVDPETKEELYSLIDGLHRFTASFDAGKETIPAQIISMADAEVLKAQLIANVHKVETKPVEYTKQLYRILGNDPLLSISKLATMLAKSPTWLSERLGLMKLTDNISKLVDEGKINLSNAYVLAKLPPEEQPNYVEQAMTKTPQEFGPVVQARKKELDKARREGRDPNAAQFVAAPHFQKISNLKAEIDNPKRGPELVKLLKLDKADSKTEAAERGFQAGIQWAVQMDPVSVEAQKKEYDARQAATAQKKEAAAKQRLDKKAADATLTAARLQYVSAEVAKGVQIKVAEKAFDDANGLVDGKKPEAPAAPVAA